MWHWEIDSISQINNFYPHWAFIEAMFNHSDGTLGTHFSTGVFSKDKPEQHESTDLVGNNTDFINRASLTNQSRKLVLLGHLHSDLFFQEKLLLNGVDVKIKLACNKDAFCLMAVDPGHCYKLNLLFAFLFVKKGEGSTWCSLRLCRSSVRSQCQIPCGPCEFEGVYYTHREVFAAVCFQSTSVVTMTPIPWLNLGICGLKLALLHLCRTQSTTRLSRTLSTMSLKKWRHEEIRNILFHYVWHGYQANPYIRKTFFSLYPCDFLPKERLLQRLAGLVVNAHPYPLPGEHCLTTYLTDDNCGIF